MKKTKLWNNVLSTKVRKAVASALALSMVLSGAAYATSDTSKTGGSIAAATADAVAFVNGDIDGDGKVTLEDAQLALKGALKIKTDFTESQMYAADVDSSGKLDLEDAQLILKAALKINPLPDKEAPSTGTDTPDVPTGGAVTTEPAVSTEPPAPIRSRQPLPTGDITPSFTPRPSLEPVPAEPENIVADYETLEVKKSNQVQAATAAGVDGKEYTQYVFGPLTADEVSEAAVSAAGLTVADVLSKVGMQMENPYKGREDLREKPVDVIRTERINDKPTVWELTGAAIVTESGLALKDIDPRVSNAEPQGHKFCDQENIDYTIPEWTKGISFSFWAEVNEENSGAPVLTFESDTMLFSVKLNGTVRFVDTTSPKQGNSLYLQSDQIVDGFNGWAHYTVTIKNDWVQVYVNGQENVYTKISMNRGTIQYFNDGFLTRYNPVGVVTQEMVDQDVRQFYTGTDSTGHTPWYQNPDTGEMEGHDDFSIFVNNRFRGAANGKTLLMDFLTDDTTRCWIGGDNGSIEESNTNRVLTMNANMADLRTYEMELTPEQVAACYEYTTVTPEAITWDVDKAERPVEYVAGTLPIVGGEPGNWAEYNEETGIVTFKAPEGRADKVTGVQLENPFAGKTELNETIEEALSGQAIFPYFASNGGTVTVDPALGAGCNAVGAEVRRGNFYDVWYGDTNLAGVEMDPPTGNIDPATPVDKIMTLEQLEEVYGDQKTTYQRPDWNKGVSVSFWAKPVEVDDSPLLTFYRVNNVLLTISVRGDVTYMSLDGKTWQGGAVVSNAVPYNTFTALGDPSYVTANEWNYYTITIANDWIQVYVNGKEMVYTEANLNRQAGKFFNSGYLTRYNQIGHWTTEMLEKFGDPTGTTLEGTPRNYLTKSEYLYDLTITEMWTDPTSGNLHSALSDKGWNSGKDSAAIRQNGVYENPFRFAIDYKNVINYLTDSKVKLYFGGVPSAISLGEQYMLQDLQMTHEQAADEEFRSLVHFNEVLYKMEDKTDEETGQIIQVPTEEEQVVSRCKFLFSDHVLDEGTQMAGFYTDMKELTAEEVAAKYAAAQAPVQ